VNGFLIPIKDSKALAEKLRILIDDADLRKRMGLNSRQIAGRDFSLDDVIAKHLAIYDKLMH
jgi:glycosyltransferase involved in cell wall biosynthesis